MNKKNIIEFTNGYTGDKISIEFAVDSGIEDWQHIFKVIAQFATWQPNQVAEMFGEEDE